MDTGLLEKFLKLMASENDSDAAMGLRGAQNLFRDGGASLEDAVRFAAGNAGQWKKSAAAIEHAPATKSAAPAAVNVSGVPECRVTRAGVLEIVPPGKQEGDSYPLPGEAARDAEAIAAGMKDAVVAGVINKSRFKLKLNDVKNNKGDIVETVLQAEYERAGMTPVRVWANSRGEVGALAAVLRKALANSMPELAAA